MIPLFWFDHVLVVAMLLLIAGAVRQQKKIEGIRFSSREKLVIYIANGLALWALALLTLGAWWWGDRPFSQMGICYPDPAAGKWSALLSGLIVATWIIDAGRQMRSKSLPNTRREWQKNTPFMPDSPKEIVWFLPLAISAGICEEVVFRGYLIRYFESLAGMQSWSSALAILVPALAFAWGHRYQKRTAMIKIFVLAIGFGALFVISGSLLWCALIHFGIDFAASLMSPYLMAGAAQSGAGTVDPIPDRQEETREFPEPAEAAGPEPSVDLKVIDPEDPGSHPRTPGG